MAINVYTDASWYHKDGSGYYAYHIESDGNIHRGEGHLKDCANSNEAELWAIYMATCAVAGIWQGGVVTYWTDSLHGVNILYKGHDNYSIRADILEILYILDITHVFNYIPRNSTKQLQWCDKTSKYYENS